MNPPERFDVILADPPWRFVTRSPKGNKRGPESHYPTMTLNELQALPVCSLAADNAALFLWCCWPSSFPPTRGDVLKRIWDETFHRAFPPHAWGCT